MASELSKIIAVDGKRRAYTTILDDSSGRWRLAIVTENEAGYHLAKDDSDAGGSFADRADAERLAAAFNERCGLAQREVGLIIASSLRYA